jgi:hypothetical protein
MMNMNLERVATALAGVAILGGIARIGMTPSALIWGENSVQELVFGLIACLFMGVGIFGVYLYQAHRLGITGLASVLLLSISSTLTAALVWSTMLGVTAEDQPFVAPMQTINSTAAMLGTIGFCVQTLRARILPAWPVVLFLLFPAIMFIPALSNWGAVLWGISYMGLGYYVVGKKSVKHPSVFGM